MFLTGNRVGQETEIGKCLSFYEAKHKEKPYAWVKIEWLWRPELQELPESFAAHPHELFTGDLFDNNPWEAIEMYDRSRLPHSPLPHRVPLACRRTPCTVLTQAPDELPDAEYPP